MTIITTAQSSVVEALVKQTQADKARDKKDEQAPVAVSDDASASGPQDTVELSVGAKLTVTIQAIKDSVGYDPTTAAKIDARVPASAPAIWRPNCTLAMSPILAQQRCKG